MKTFINFPILFCMTSMLLISACERAEIQSALVTKLIDIVIETRSDCQECPDLNECCCGVYLQNPETEDADITLCGTSDGPDLCSGATFGDCEVNSGGGHTFMLDEFNDKERFCMLQGSSFWIRNNSTTTSANIYISCQEDITNPQILQVTIPANSRNFYDVSGSCTLMLCISE